MFDREVEWSDLVAFATDETPGATLGVVSGRRRQGKTYLLDSLAQAADGTLIEARGTDVSQAVPACFGGAGFTPELRAAERRREVVLVDPERLYGGDRAFVGLGAGSKCYLLVTCC